MQKSSPSQCHLVQLLRNCYAKYYCTSRILFANFGLYINSHQKINIAIYIQCMYTQHLIVVVILISDQLAETAYLNISI